MNTISVRPTNSGIKMVKYLKLDQEASLVLQMYVLSLLNISKTSIHSSKVIPSEFGQFPEFETMIPGLKFDRLTGWFSIDQTI